MTRPAILLRDNLDDRREIWRLLTRLPPRGRVSFLAWCCGRSVLEDGRSRPKVARKTRDLADLAARDSSADERLSLDVWLDLWHLASHYRFDLDCALTELVRRVR